MLQSSQVFPYAAQPQLTQSFSYFPQTTQTSVSQILPGTSYTAPVTQTSQIYSPGLQLSQVYPTTQMSQVYGSSRIHKKRHDVLMLCRWCGNVYKYKYS